MNCPNFNDCKLVQTNQVINNDEPLKSVYINKYCTVEDDVWEDCKRYQTKLQLQFCPDFVLPDSTYTIEEIMDKYDEDIFKDNN